ncbi:MAG: hypothetical protein FWC32_04685 [Firmicutes bacterium]|nr:hypothetical protein [Bacillota bacterium]
MPRRKIKKLIAGSDSAVKLVAPKVVTAGVNVMRMGPRIILRSTVELLRMNLFTRILSCITILIFDIYDISRKRISKTQFTVNVILSIILVVTGTVGWNFGGRWLIFEVMGGIADVIGGMIGAGITVLLSSVAFGKACNKLIESDAQKMWKIINPHIDKLPEEERFSIRDSITGSCLKKMFACKDREAFADDLVNTLHELYLEEAASEN